mgnify:CR=1 FL=1
MNNPLDNKIKESLENFEMPYDAGAWAELAQQLPAAGTATSAGGSQIGWKAAALVAVLATTIATAWYFTNTDKTVITEDVAIEQTVPAEEVNVVNSEETETVNQETSTQKAITEVKAHVADAKATNTNAVVPVVKEETQPVVKTENVVATTDNNSNLTTDKKEPTTPEKEPSNEVTAKPFVAKFLASTLIACVGDDVSFINESSDKSASMRWDFGDGTTEVESNPVHNYVNEGTYTVRLVGSKNNQTAEHTVTVNVNPTPTPIFSAERKLNGYVAIPLYKFATAVQPSETAIWSFSDGAKAVGNSVVHLFREAGTSTASVTVSNNYGCSTTMSESYDALKEFDLLAPTSFTPNGDGLNENFIPEALPEMGIAFEMSILDPKTNEVVYRTSNALDAWNGTRNNSGQKLDEGIYIWTVVLKENVVNNKVFNGKITLSR